MKRFIGFMIIFLLLCASCSKTADAIPPDAVKKPTSKDMFQTKLTDDYSYFKEKDTDDVLKYIEEENNYTEKMTSHTKKLQEKLYQEIIGRIDETDQTVPELKDSFYYYSKDEKGKEYPIYLRKLANEKAVEETLLNMNTAGKDYLFYAVSIFEMTNDHRFLAFSYDTTGAEKYALKIYDTKEKRFLNDRISDITSMTWLYDGSGFYYTVEDDISRSYAVYLHIIGEDADKMIFEENDEKYSVYLSMTRSKDYILLSNMSNITSEISYIRSDDRSGVFKAISKRIEGVEYYVDYSNGYFYVLTNRNAVNFKVLRMKENQNLDKAEVFLNKSDTITIEGIDCFKDYISVYERIKGIKNLRVISMKDNKSRYFDFKESNYTFYPYSNSTFDTDKIRINFMSLKTPSTTIDINMSDFTTEVKKRQNVKKYNSDDYVTEYIFAKSHDGKEIPISLVYSKKIDRNKPNPLLMDGYGAYGSTSDPYFSSSKVSLLDRGVIFAIAHIRGGADMGRGWYEDGKLLNKKNTFLDFISCAEHLIEAGYTSKDNLIITGGSAGGLLIGAVLNMRPDLFKGAVVNVPFVDVINTMLDSTLPLTVGEFDEWGDPANENFFKYMIGYSPYDNVKKADYPAILITAGYNDVRVMYWEPLKWVAKLRDNKTDNNPLLLKITMNAGHGGGSGRYSYYKDIAFEYAFILDILKM